MKSRGSQKAMSLVETIVVIAIFSIISISISLWIVGFYKTYGFMLAQAQNVMKAEKAIATMVREIREASTAQDGAYILATTTDYAFSFYSDVDSDDNIELINYYIEGNKFIKSIVKPIVGPPADYVNGSIVKIIEASDIINGPSVFKYFDKDGNELLTTPIRRKDTEMMQVDIIINTNPGRISNYELKSNVQLRNLKSNI
ncbi:MAG TPA: prepilin-type N-terminal cleavage/methylation domain-containing protein [Candidatus Pacearchaeota archaeon]|nr:prepilin-type N-terminal cleavage/methylation domain-containing protein [Candidatus Pacearchaeota archaeon]